MSAATVAFGLLAVSAQAQLAPAPAAKPAVVTPAPTAAPVAKAPVAPTMKAPGSGTAGAAAPVAKKVASACKGLEEAVCKTNTECGWIVPTKVDAKTGKADKAYCRKVAGIAKKPATAATPAVKAVAPAGTVVAPKAVTAPATPAVKAPAGTVPPKTN